MRTGQIRATMLAVLALLGTLLVAGPLCQVSFGQAVAPSAEDITRALTQPPNLGKSRSFRGVEVQPGEAPGPPSIDLYVNFRYDSADLEPDAMIALRSLGVALRSPQLKDAKIQIVGHTDATGTDDYNLKLSERRAASVRQFLIFSHDIDAARLEAIGRGKSQLKDATRPTDGINRRVEVRNVSTATQ